MTEQEQQTQQPDYVIPDIPSHAEDDGMLRGRDIILPATLSRPYPIRGHLWEVENPLGRVVILPGFTEFCEKYSQFAAFLTEAGFDCLLIDWPGQGASGHLGIHPLLVHIDDYAQHHHAISELVAEAGFAGKPFSVIGHSMGGHLALHCHQLFGYEIEQIILLSPMIVPKSPPLWFVVSASRLLSWFGMKKHSIPGVALTETHIARRFRIDNMLTTDPDGYDRQYRIFEKKAYLRRYRPTVGWVAATFRSCLATTLNPEWMRSITVPVHGFVAADEQVVNLAKSIEMLSYLGHGQIQLIENARHELLNERRPVKQRIYHAVLACLHSPPDPLSYLDDVPDTSPEVTQEDAVEDKAQEQKH